MSGKYERKKEVRPGKTGKGSKTLLIVLAVILAVILALVIAVVVYYNYAMGKLNQVDVPKVNYTSAATEAEDVYQFTEQTEPTEETVPETTEEATEPHVASRADYINFLVVGQDYREGEENHLADSMIVCTLNTYEKSLTLTSILRDTLVQVSGSYTDTKGVNHTYGGVKINMIYASGYLIGTADAMGWMNQALYDNFGLEIDHNIEVDFQAFMEFIDQLGGIDLEVNQAEADYLNDQPAWVSTHIEPGLAHFDGCSALAYVRIRKAQGDQGDITRTERQRKFVTAVVERLKTMDISTVQRIIDNVLPYISTSMSTSEITTTIAQLLPMLKDLTVTSGGTCPMNPGDKEVDLFGNGEFHHVLTFNPTEVKEYMRALTLGEKKTK